MEEETIEVAGNGLKLDRRGETPTPGEPNAVAAAPEENERAPKLGAFGSGGCCVCAVAGGSERIGAVCERLGRLAGTVDLNFEDGGGDNLGLERIDCEGPSFSAARADRGRKRWNSYFAARR